MTLPTNGTITTDQILAELRVSNPGRNYPLNLLDADVLALAGKTAAPVNLPNDFYGKSSYVAMSAYIPEVDTAAGASSGTYTWSTSVGVEFTGGKGPFTFAWSKVSGSGSVRSVDRANTVSEFYVVGAPPPDTSYSQVVQCVITDATGATITAQGTVRITFG